MCLYDGGCIGEEKVMGQKTTKNIGGLSKSKKQQARRKGRQLQVLHRKVLGQTVREIAESTGFSEATLWKDIKELRDQGIDKDLIERERNIHIKALPIATAVLFAHLMLGDKEVAMGMSKGLRVWTDKLDIVAKVEPDDQQKKMMENMETLLKLSRDKVKVALPEGTTATEKIKEEGNLAIVKDGKFTGYDDKVALPEKVKESKKVEVETKMVDQSKKIMDTEPAYDEDVAGMVKIKETETQSQLGSEKTEDRRPMPKRAPPGQGKPMEIRRLTKEEYDKVLSDQKGEEICTCDFGHQALGDPISVDPKCPVHGDKDGVVEFTESRDRRPMKRSLTHRDKEQGGDTTIRGGSVV